MITDHSLRAGALRNLAVSLAKAGQFEDADATAQSIGNEPIRASTQNDLAAALAKLGEIKQAIELVTSIANLSERAAAVQSVIKQHLQSNSPKALVPHLLKLDLSRNGWTRVLFTWRKELLRHADAPLPLLRESLTLYPFDQEAATKGVYALVQGHVQAGDLDTAADIAAACPELQLDVLVTESEGPPLPDDYDPETLPDPFRATFDALVAAHADGEIDDATFTAKAEMIFEMDAM